LHRPFSGAKIGDIKTIALAHNRRAIFAKPRARAPRRVVRAQRNFQAVLEHHAMVQVCQRM